MSFRTMLTTTGAVLGAGALALAPTAANAAITSLTVSGSNAGGALVGSASVTMPVYGTPKTLSCSSGSVTGTWNTGAKTATFSGLSLSGCTSLIPGTTVTLSLNSALTFTRTPVKP